MSIEQLCRRLAGFKAVEGVPEATTSHMERETRLELATSSLEVKRTNSYS